MAKVAATKKRLKGDSDQVAEVDDSSDRIIEPFDPSLIRVDTKLMTLDLLLSRMEHNEIDLAPGFQRKGGIWTEEAMSRLIESILIRIPLPAFYMDSSNEEKWLVVDGLQRLTALKRFVLDQTLELTGLEYLTQFKGYSYKDLPRGFQRRIFETQVTVFLIEKETPFEVKFNIFKRINTGGLPLSPQEIRHALNQGPAVDYLNRLATSKEFKQGTDGSVPDDRMEDRDYVLRFLGFALVSYDSKEIKESTDFDSFLNDTMARINDLAKHSPDKLDDLATRFLRAMKAAHEIFGPHAFRKRYSEMERRWPINKALFEAWSVNLANLSPDQLKVLIKRKAAVKKKSMTLMGDRTFENAISQGTSNARKIATRFSKVEQLISEVLQG